MRTQNDYKVAYIATDAQGKELEVNYCDFKTTEAVKYLAQHEIEVIPYDIYKYHGRRGSWPIDEPLVPLTKKAAELVDAMTPPLSWSLIVERLT